MVNPRPLWTECISEYFWVPGRSLPPVCIYKKRSPPLQCIFLSILRSLTVGRRRKFPKHFISKSLKINGTLEEASQYTQGGANKCTEILKCINKDPPTGVHFDRVGMVPYTSGIVSGFLMAVFPRDSNTLGCTTADA